MKFPFNFFFRLNSVYRLFRTKAASPGCCRLCCIFFPVVLYFLPVFLEADEICVRNEAGADQSAKASAKASAERRFDARGAVRSARRVRCQFESRRVGEREGVREGKDSKRPAAADFMRISTTGNSTRETRFKRECNDDDLFLCCCRCSYSVLADNTKPQQTGPVNLFLEPISTQ